jgi:hypothetical protein
MGFGLGRVLFFGWVVEVCGFAAHAPLDRKLTVRKRMAAIPTAGPRRNDRPMTTIGKHYRKGWLFRATSILLPSH